MKDSLVSIIVPAYNVAEYLNECVDSILAQTYKDIEVILVDDGSTEDNTPRICDDYAVKDKRVKVVHKVNGGSTKARESGVEVSTGEQIFFVDADDSIEPDSVESLLSLMTDDVDIVAAEGDVNKKMTPVEWGTYFLSWHSIHLWGKLYRRSVVADNWVFDFDRGITVADDFITNLRCLRNLKRNVVVSKIKKYHYRQLPQSLVHKFKLTPEYEQMILNEAIKVMEQTPMNLKQGFAVYQLGILKHFICWRYKADDAWLNDLRTQALSVRLSCNQRLVLRAASNDFFSTIVRLREPFFKGVKLIQRKIRWR